MKTQLIPFKLGHLEKKFYNDFCFAMLQRSFHPTWLNSSLILLLCLIFRYETLLHYLNKINVNFEANTNKLSEKHGQFTHIYI